MLFRSEWADKTTPKNAAAAVKAGIPIGYYHFATLGNANPLNPCADSAAEAGFFLRKLSGLPPSSQTMPPMLDLESEKVLLSPQQVGLWVSSFAISVLNNNKFKTVGIYSGKYWLDEHLPPGHSFGRWPLWLAQYTDATVPQLPVGWKDWFLWQYTDKGKVDGITGPVDLSRLP